MPSHLQLDERVSHLSATSHGKDPDAFQGMKTPGDLDLEGGALREGGAPNLFSRQYIGLVIQYAAIGLIYGTLPETVYPLLQKYLNAPGTVLTSADTLISLPWSFKVFYGIMSDCFPIFGYRRRPYMLIGWSLCILMLIVMACTPIGPPYFSDPQYRDTKPDDYNSTIEATLNRSASTKGGLYVVLMMLCTFGYLIADVASDGVVCELAQREPMAVRGRTQTIIYTTRSVMIVVAELIIAFAFNGHAYGGDFNFSIKFPTLMLILAILLAPVMPLTWFFIHEEKMAAPAFKGYMGEFWTALQTRAFYQIIFYKFFSGIFENFVYVSEYTIKDHWAKVTTLNDKISSIFGESVQVLTFIVTLKYGLQWNWRYMAAITMVSVVCLDSICTMLTVWDVVRSPWFWLGVPIVEKIPKGVQFIVSTYVTVELAGEGNEGAVYGLLTTVVNLSDPFARTIAKNVDSAWDLSTERIQNDSHEVRRDITLSIMVMYAAKLMSLAFLFLLPAQKAQTQELKRNGGSSKLCGILTVGYLLFALIWTQTTNILAIFPSTACLKIAGGEGC